MAPSRDVLRGHGSCTASNGVGASDRSPTVTVTGAVQVCHRAFTLVELLVVMAIISVLASLLLPALQNAIGSARSIACLSQLKQQGMASGMYIDDNGGWTITAYRYNKFWYYVLDRDYSVGQRVFRCPAESCFAYDPKKVNYGLNILTFGEAGSGGKNLIPHKASAIERFGRATSLIVLLDTPPVCSETSSIRNSSANATYWESTARIAGINSTSSDWYPSFVRHQGNLNALMFDGHVQTVSGNDMLFRRNELCNPCMKSWTDGSLAIRTFTSY